MAKKEKTMLDKKNWQNQFTIIGEAKINDYTYKINERSEKSDWVYNSLNLGVFCGETCGTVYSELMGGYGADRDNVIYVHGKDEDGKDDFENRFTVDWYDRFDQDILDTIGDLCFLKVGLEKDKDGKVYYNNFLSAYDAIAYVKENLKDGMVVNVKGNIKYSTYNNNVQTKKEINSIVLSKVDDKSKYCARFKQSMLLTKDSVGKPDKNTGILPIYAKVLDYVKEYNGKEVKANIPYNKTFEYELDLSNKDMCEKVVEKVFKVKKDVTQITFEGDFIEGGAMVTSTEDDIPNDIKELIEIGVYTLEEALAKCTVDSGKERRMVLRKPVIKLVEDKNGDKTPVIQKFEKKYTEDDLILDFMFENVAEEAEESDNEVDNTDVNEGVDASDDDWLNNL